MVHVLLFSPYVKAWLFISKITQGRFVQSLFGRLSNSEEVKNVSSLGIKKIEHCRIKFGCKTTLEPAAKMY